MSEPKHRTDPSGSMDRADRDFVARLEAAYRAPELPPSRRVAFREGLDRRIGEDRAARRWKGLGLAGAVALSAALAWIGLGSLPVPTEPTLVADSTLETPATPEPFELAPAEPTLDPVDTTDAETETIAMNLAADATPEEALLSFGYEPLTDDATSLPEEYEAIESLFLGSG